MLHHPRHVILSAATMLSRFEYRQYCCDELNSHCSEVVTNSRVYIMGHAAEQAAQPAAAPEVASSYHQPRTALQSRLHSTQSENTGNSPCRLQSVALQAASLQSVALQAAGPPYSKATITLQFRSLTTVLHNHHLTAKDCLLTPKISRWLVDSWRQTIVSNQNCMH